MHLDKAPNSGSGDIHGCVIRGVFLDPLAMQWPYSWLPF